MKKSVQKITVVKKLLECPCLKTSSGILEIFLSIPWNGELLLAATGDRPPLKTQFKCFYDNENLFFLIECEDTDIRATMKEPNSKVWLEEAVELFIAPCSENPQVYYEFQLSPANVCRHVRVTATLEKSQSFIFDDSWKCKGVKTATYIHGYLNDPTRKSKGWQVIISLPLKCFTGGNSTVKAGDMWRINIFRIDRWPEEMYCAWSPTFHEPPMFHSPEHFGHLIFT